MDPIGRSGQPHVLATAIGSPIAQIRQQDDRLSRTAKFEQLIVYGGHRLTLVAPCLRHEIAGDQVADHHSWQETSDTSIARGIGDVLPS